MNDTLQNIGIRMVDVWTVTYPGNIPYPTYTVDSNNVIQIL